MSADPQAATVARAQARAEAARQRLSQSASTLQARLDPRVVARDAMDNLQDSSERALRTGIRSAQAYPERVVWGLTVALAWLARRRIAAAFASKRQLKAETDARLARSIPGDWPQSAERKSK